MLHLVAKYWCNMMQMGLSEVIRSRNECKVGNLNLGSWALSLRKELHEI
jgi:hypothetical protein